MRLVFAPITAALALALFSADSAAQAAPDYVFNVPVRVANAPPLDGRAVAVRCTIQAYNASGGWLSTPTAYQLIPIGPTGYTGTVRMEIALPPGVARANVRRWSCNLELTTVTSPTGEAVRLPGANSEAMLDNYPAVTGQSIATRNTHAGADFRS